MANSDVKNPNLKHNKALYEKRLIFGVPSKLFVLVGALVVIFVVTSGLIAGLVAIAVFVVPLIMIHQHDEQAFFILLDKLRRPNFYTGGGFDEITLKTVEVKNNKLFLGEISDME